MILFLGIINNLFPFLFIGLGLLFLGELSEFALHFMILFYYVFFIPHVVRTVFFVPAVTWQTYRGTYSIRRDRPYLVFFCVSLLPVSWLFYWIKTLP